MGFEGFVVLGAAVLLFAYVIPGLVRRRVVLADAPIEDRFAEDLRMLEVSQAQPPAHAGGQHGSVFFRRPEVEMAGSEFSAKDVRELARDRSRARARISRRAAFMRRILMGVAALAALAAVLWIATALTPLPAVAAVGATAVTGACAVGFGYLRREVAKADAVDRQTVADIDAELGPRRAHGRRRAVDIVRARTLAQARREAARGSSSHGSSDAEEIAVRGRGRKADAGVCDRATERAAGHGRDAERGGRGSAGGGHETAGRRGRAEGAQSAALDGMTEREKRARAKEPGPRVRAGKASAQDTSAQEGGSSEGRSAAQSASAAGGKSRAVKRPNVRAELAKARIAERASTASARSASRSAAERPMKPSPRAEMPPYTLKPRKIERRVVEPYAAPASATAPVPYRPHERGERYDAATGTVMPSASASNRNAASLAGGAGIASGASSDTAGSPADPARAEKPRVEEAKPVISSRSEEVLGGGSVLDALLERRRA